MFVKGFRQKAEDYRVRASYAQTAIDRDWAAYCAGILEEQAAHFERTGRCPEVRLPDRPSIFRSAQPDVAAGEVGTASVRSLSGQSDTDKLFEIGCFSRHLV
jgi:hypothetical protein